MLFISRLLYQTSLGLYRAGIGLWAMLGNEKAQKWVKGRKDWSSSLAAAVSSLPAGPRIWLHAASLGEFEQGRPVLEAIRQQWPHCQIILTFFSPSGYEQQKDFQAAAVVAYLPLDTPANAAKFLDIVAPQAALFVKYEFWYFYLQALHQRRIPTLLFSAAFRQEQSFFKWYGALFRQMLSWYHTIQVQDEKSLSLLQQLQLPQPVELGGDTRYDRVLAIAAQAASFEKIEAFKERYSLMIAGSTWPADESLLAAWLQQRPPNWKLVLAPHEINEAHLQSIEKLFGASAIRYSAFTGAEKHPVLIIDNIGMLSSLYRYGDIAFIGGGFASSGIHNTLEPAVFGLPVIMGPHYEKFSEARLLVEKGFAFPVKNTMELNTAFKHLAQQASVLQPVIKSAIATQAGATGKVLAWLRAHLPL